MCGIFGFACSNNLSNGFNYDKIGLLADHSESRGKDSSGIVFKPIDASEIKVIKGDIRLKKLLKNKIVKQASNEFFNYSKSNNSLKDLGLLMGHARLVTNGSQLSHTNNQPVIKNNNLICIHNGIIVNDKDCYDKFKDLNREYEIDTEILLSLIDKNLKNGYSLDQSISLSINHLVGTLSVALYCLRTESLALFSNNGSLFYLTDKKNFLYFASEKFPLELIKESMKDSLFLKDTHIGQLNQNSGGLIIDKNFNFSYFQLDISKNEIKKLQSQNGNLPKIDYHNIANNNRTDLIRSLEKNNDHNLESLLEFNNSEIDLLTRCSRCILPSTFPYISFNVSGVCNYCENYKIRNQPKPLELLLESLEPYKSNNGSNDCLIPYSGGRDSTFALYFAKEKLGLNPIAYTYDWGMLTDLGRRNISRVCAKMNVENIIHAADIRFKRKNINKNLTAWLSRPELGMLPLLMAGDKYFYYFVDKVKKSTNINLNIWGVNPLENTDFKVGFQGIRPDFEKKYIFSLSFLNTLKLFSRVGVSFLKNPKYINSSLVDSIGSFFARSIKPHKDYFQLYDYIKWDENEVNELILDYFDWELAEDTQTTWRIGDGTAAFYNYVYYNVAGFSEHDTFRSNQIREGQITREDAIELTKDENRPRYPTMKWYLDIVGVDFKNAIEVVNRIPKAYRY